MKTEFITEKSEETKKLGKLLAGELSGGEIICLSGELGAGKTTFTQGLLEGLGAQKPYTSPTFVVMKEYQLKNKKTRNPIKKIYHFDAYRVAEKDFSALGWEEIIADNSFISIIEWADKLEDIIPERAIWIGFSWLDEDKRKLKIGKKDQNLLKSQKRAKNT
jgi:tRNA threonylcarbamoyladenosine biosynthesis protein TsaE